MSLSAIPDLFNHTGAPAGFRYAPDVLPASEEKRLVGVFGTLAFKPFEFHGHLGNRRIVSFGHRYDYAAQTLRTAEPIPEFLLPVRDIAAGLSGVPASSFQQALVTEYAPGAGIGWHRDKPMFQDIVGLSFLSPCQLRLRRKLGTKWERRAVEIAPRSAYLLRGAVREEWEHSIVPMDKLRYSVTFRTFRD